MLEIERRFICRVTDGEELRRAPAAEIRQGYLTDTGPAIRVRRIGDSYLMTVKTGQGMIREEIEFSLPTDAGEALLRLAGTRIVDKRRYRIDRWEIDIFEGKLEGLILAEVELDSTREPLPPVPDSIELITEITDDPSYGNHSLALLDAAAARDFVERVRERHQ